MISFCEVGPLEQAKHTCRPAMETVWKRQDKTVLWHGVKLGKGKCHGIDWNWRDVSCCQLCQITFSDTWTQLLCGSVTSVESDCWRSGTWKRDVTSSPHIPRSPMHSSCFQSTAYGSEIERNRMVSIKPWIPWSREGLGTTTPFLVSWFS